MLSVMFFLLLPLSQALSSSSSITTRVAACTGSELWEKEISWTSQWVRLRVCVCVVGRHLNCCTICSSESGTINGAKVKIRVVSLHHISSADVGRNLPEWQQQNNHLVWNLVDPSCKDPFSKHGLSASFVQLEGWRLFFLSSFFFRGFAAVWLRGEILGNILSGALGEQFCVSAEGFQSWMWRGLTFLLPFLFFGHVSVYIL